MYGSTQVMFPNTGLEIGTTEKLSVKVMWLSAKMADFGSNLIISYTT